jgi:hypothetical protein
MKRPTLAINRANERRAVHRTTRAASFPPKCAWLPRLEPGPMQRIGFVLPAEDDQSMRLHIDKRGTDDRVNMIALIALLLLVGSAIFYLGQSFIVPSQPADFFGPVSRF